ncbi:DNA adenine methylase [Polaribacter sp. OB-PA-B3]
MSADKSIIAKPFLKWAGGKTQLIEEIKNNLPLNITNDTFTFIEPFVGGGAVFFWMMENFPNIQNAVINDINTDLTDCYITIQQNVEELIEVLDTFQTEYHDIFQNIEKSKEYYYTKRDLFNSRESDRLVQSALFVFLNKTCFNGLYRVNSKNKFNVPIGRSKSLPKICDQENLLLVSEVLQRTTILNGDYAETLRFVDNNAFFYFDPPYKPLSETSSFNSYAKDVFDDAQQIRLKEFCNTIDNLGYQWMLSNSDMKNVNPEDNFFDDLYQDFNIFRVYAKRTINSKAKKRGNITELLITNL